MKLKLVKLSDNVKNDYFKMVQSCDKLQYPVSSCLYLRLTVVYKRETQGSWVFALIFVLQRF